MPTVVRAYVLADDADGLAGLLLLNSTEINYYL